MAWVLGAAMGLGLAMAASVAVACPGPCGAPYAPGGDYAPEGYDGGYYEAPPSPDELSNSFGYARQHYAWPCGCGAERVSYGADAGQVYLPGGFFAGAGGVGPIPSDGYGYGGGYWVMNGDRQFVGRRVFLGPGGFRGGFHGGRRGR